MAEKSKELMKNSDAQKLRNGLAVLGCIAACIGILSLIAKIFKK